NRSRQHFLQLFLAEPNNLSQKWSEVIAGEEFPCDVRGAGNVSDRCGGHEALTRVATSSCAGYVPEAIVNLRSPKGYGRGSSNSLEFPRFPSTPFCLRQACYTIAVPQVLTPQPSLDLLMTLACTPPYFLGQ